MSIEKNESNKSIERLQYEAKQQLLKLQAQEKQIIHFQSCADIFIKRKHVNESYFGKVAYEYGKLSGWIQGLLFVLVLGIAIGICLFLPAAIPFSIITIIIYSTIAFFLYNHYRTIKQQDKCLQEDINTYESSLKISIEHLNGIGESLNNVFNSLCHMNIQQATDILAFEDQIKKLEQQTKAFNESAQTLDLSNEILINNESKFNASYQKAQSSVDKLIQALSEQMNIINTSTEKSFSVINFTHTCQELNSAYIQYNQNLTELNANLTNIFHEINKHIPDPQQVHNDETQKRTTDLLAEVNQMLIEEELLQVKYTSEYDRNRTNTSSIFTPNLENRNIELPMKIDVHRSI